MKLPTESLPIDRVVTFLTNHQQSLRIKKLIFYTVKNYWENDQTLLNKLNLKPLIIELQTVNPTIDDATEALGTAVASLNRQEVYLEICKVIIAKLKKLYDDSEVTDATTGAARLSKPQVTGAQLELLCKRLQKNQEAERIKKIIFYISKKYWEHDINVIEELGITSLIRQIREEFLSFAEFKKHLFAAVDTLNRPSLYYNIAIDIIQDFQILYNEPDLTGTLIATPEQTLPIRGVKNQGTQLLSEEFFTPVIVEKPKGNPQEKLTERPQIQIKSYDLLEMRLYLSQYANPLRAKIVLFSLIYHVFGDTEKDWSMLKSCTLEDLILKVFDGYSSLYEVQEKLDYLKISLKNQETLSQTSTVIIQALTSFYESMAT